MLWKMESATAILQWKTAHFSCMRRVLWPFLCRIAEFIYDIARNKCQNRTIDSVWRLFKFKLYIKIDEWQFGRFWNARLLFSFMLEGEMWINDFVLSIKCSKSHSSGWIVLNQVKVICENTLESRHQEKLVWVMEHFRIQMLLFSLFFSKWRYTLKFI